jgi:hypothetical protein
MLLYGEASKMTDRLRIVPEPPLPAPKNLDKVERRYWNTAQAKLDREVRLHPLTPPFLEAAVWSYHMYRRFMDLLGEMPNGELAKEAEETRVLARQTLVELLVIDQERVSLAPLDDDGLDVDLVRFFEEPLTK